MNFFWLLLLSKLYFYLTYLRLALQVSSGIFVTWLGIIAVHDKLFLMYFFIPTTWGQCLPNAQENRH